MALDRMARLMAGAGLAMMALTQTDNAHAEGWSFATGVDYSSGNYNEAVDTEIYAAPFSVGYSADRWSVEATLPYVWLDGSGHIAPGVASAFGVGSGFGTGGATVGGGGGAASAGASLNLTPSGLLNLLTPASAAAPAPLTVRRHEEGLGDATLAASFSPYVTSSGARLVLGASFRLPTGDEDKSLGAGETIGAVTASYALPVGERSALYGTIGYQKGFEDDDGGALAAFGGETRLSDRFLLGANVGWAESAVSNVPEQTEATLYAGADVSERVRLAFSVLAGLSDSSPDWGAGVHLVLH